MSNLGILTWLNENSKGPYPLSRELELHDLIVDASFIQYNNFIPILNKLIITDSVVSLTIQFDKETKIVTKSATNFNVGDAVRIYGVNNRYMGTIIFGPGLLYAIEHKAGANLTLNIPFASSTVASARTDAGVYSIQGVTGDVTFTTSDQLFFGLDIDNNSGYRLVDLNAVSIPEVPDSSIKPLKTLNSVAPISNNIVIADSDILKIKPSSNGLSFTLANSPLNDNIAPTVTYE